MEAMTERRRSRRPQRATQGFVSTLTYVWSHPSLTAIEIAWRWGVGIPALFLIYRSGSGVLAAVPWRSTGIQTLSANELLTDPMQASAKLVAFADVIMPGLMHTLVWLAPVLLGAWALLSTAGRTVLLHRLDPALKPHPGTLLALQVLRLLPIISLGVGWWLGLQSLATYSIVNPIVNGGEPQTMLYVGGVILLSLSVFVFAAGISWIFTAAPVIAMRDDLGAIASLVATARLHNLRGSLFEINMVLAIVKIMLLVLAVAFSAFPLPFANVMTEGYILLWSIIITVWYFAASDLFHVARLHGYIALLRASASRREVA